MHLERNEREIQLGQFTVGAEAFEKYKEFISKDLCESIERNKIVLKGPVATPIGGGFTCINVLLRKKFEFYANFRRSKTCPGSQPDIRG